MTGAIKKAEQIKARMPDAFMLQQFESTANPEIHYASTGPEIWKDTKGTIDYLVSGEHPSVPDAPSASCTRARATSQDHVVSWCLG